MSRAISVVAASLIAISTLLALSQPVAAHERRTIGPYEVVVGWIGEPAFVGQVNAVDFRVTDTRTNPAKNVEGLEKTVSVEILSGGATTGFKAAFRARFGLPGQYAADIVPTRDGAYRFKVTGKIESTDVNETFESGPGRFDEIRPLTALQYPEAVPTGADLSKRLGDIQSSADQARLAAIGALVLGIASIALAFRPRKA